MLHVLILQEAGEEAPRPQSRASQEGWVLGTVTLSWPRGAVGDSTTPSVEEPYCVTMVQSD